MDDFKVDLATFLKLLTSDSDKSETKKQYISLAKKYHPDSASENLGKTYNEYMMLLNKLYAQWKAQGKITLNDGGVPVEGQFAQGGQTPGSEAQFTWGQTPDPEALFTQRRHAQGGQTPGSEAPFAQQGQTPWERQSGAQAQYSQGQTNFAQGGQTPQANTGPGGQFAQRGQTPQTWSFIPHTGVFVSRETKPRTFKNYFEYLLALGKDYYWQAHQILLKDWGVEADDPEGTVYEALIFLDKAKQCFNTILAQAPNRNDESYRFMIQNELAKIFAMNKNITRGLSANDGKEIAVK